MKNYLKLMISKTVAERSHFGSNIESLLKKLVLRLVLYFMSIKSCARTWIYFKARPSVNGMSKINTKASITQGRVDWIKTDKERIIYGGFSLCFLAGAGRQRSCFVLCLQAE